MQRLGGGDRQYPGPGAEIEHAARPMRLQDVAEQHKAATGGSVVAGAEGERGLDLDAELVRDHFRSIMLAVEDETAGMNRNQIL